MTLIINLNNVIIFGDSYSTFKGYIPEGYATYYSEEETNKTDVRKVAETWWHQLISETNSNLILNNSWSGSTICNTGWDNTDCSETYSFVCRFNNLKEAGFFKENKIDTVFFFGGTNDDWLQTSLGQIKFGDWEKQDLYSVMPAVTYLFNGLKEELPLAKIVCVINTQLKPELVTGLKTASKHYGITSVELKDIEKTDGHPTVAGMKSIKNQILNTI